MGFVCLELIHGAPLDKLDYPAGIKIHAETDPAAMLAQMLHREPKPPRTGGSQHQPVRATGEIFIRECFGKHLIIRPEIQHLDAALRNTRGAASLKYEFRKMS